MKVLVIKLNGYEVLEFTNVTILTWNNNTFTVLGFGKGDNTQTSYEFNNNAYIVRIINN